MTRPRTRTHSIRSLLAHGLLYNRRGIPVARITDCQMSRSPIDDTQPGDTWMRYRPGPLHIQYTAVGIGRPRKARSA